MAYENYSPELPPPPYTPPNSETFSTSTHYKYRDNVICSKCGQLHEPNGTHLYDYYQTVDEDLVCHICLQPLVNPIDTKCGHTYCSKCLKNYLKLQKMCPVDRQPLTVSECQKSSLLVRRLLDKLLVVCPNVDYCEEVLPRSELDAHLAHRCRGAITKCIKASLGCTFQGPRSALQSHLWECHYRDQQTGKNPVLDGEVSTIEIQRQTPDLGMSIVGGCDTPLSCVVIQEVFAEGTIAKDGRLQPGDQILEVNGEDLIQASHYYARKALSHYFPICRITVYREKAEEERPIEKEEILRITLNKSKSRQLGIKLVGKRCQNALLSGKGLMSKRNALVGVVGVPVYCLTYQYPNDPKLWNCSRRHLETLDQMRNGPGVFILNLVPGSLAAVDGRLRSDDRVLEINGMDVVYSTQEQAAKIIQTSHEKVQFVISRKSRPQTPDIIRSTSDTLSGLDLDLDESGMWAACKKCRELNVIINKEPSESLGISVAGGICSPRGDTPIYVTNINPNGCLGLSGQIQRGDILLCINGTSLLGLTHTEAVAQVKCHAGSKVVTLKIIEAPETAVGHGNFVPSWIYWQQLPGMCHTIRTITLLRSPSGSLGFSVVGGSDCLQGSLPIYVKSVVLETPAFKDGRLKCGDTILSVNETSLDTITHSQAVEVLKQATGAVSLKVVSWPGTVV